jgi:N-sulfoglucosamine sulfohydrolase
MHQPKSSKKSRYKKLILIAIHLIIGINLQNSMADNSHKLPNILWLVSEDNSPFLGCYGDKNATTPNLDQLAKEGIVYDNAFANAPVCAPMRNSIITGVYASTLGCQNMRSYNPIPTEIKFFTQYLRQAGYYCTNNSKEDYNTIKPDDVWDESSRSAHYMNRKSGQPFFAVFNTNLSHEHKIHFTNIIEQKDLLHDPAQMKVAPYHPDLPAIRNCYATYYDYVTRMDAWIGEKLKELEESGLADETIVFYYSDHGGVLPRSKRFLYESGTRVPFIVRIPEKYKQLRPGKESSRQDRLISLIDLAPTVLSLADIKIPEYMSGKSFLGPQKTEDPEYLYFFRQRMDERYDMMRAVRDMKFTYIRNYMPHRIYGQHLWYLWRSPATRAWEAAYIEGKCDEIQSHFWQTKPAEELYDRNADPYNTKNLATDPAYRDDLIRMRNETNRWVRENHDAGFLPEGLMMDMAGEGTIYDLTHKKDFPINRIIETAEMASMKNKSNLPELINRLSDAEAAVRYWAVTGCTILGSDAKSAMPNLKNLLKDPVADVRITAAEALCKMGYKQESLNLLVSELKNKNQKIQLHALNVLDELGDDPKIVIKELMSVFSNAKDRDNYYQKVAIQIMKKLKPGWEDYVSW